MPFERDEKSAKPLKDRHRHERQHENGNANQLPAVKDVLIAGDEVGGLESAYAYASVGRHAVYFSGFGAGKARAALILDRIGRLPRRHSRFLPPFPLSNPVIPAKAGIQTASSKPATRNQARIASDKSLPPLWAYMGRF